MPKLLPRKAAVFGTPIVAMIAAVLLFGPEAASAQTCIQDVWKAHGNKQNVTCTANDVTLASATNINITAGGSCDHWGVRVLCRPDGHLHGGFSDGSDRRYPL